MLLSCGGLLAQQVDYSDVEANGTGPSEAIAIQDGLRLCITQVCGVTIAADTKLEIVEATLTANGAVDNKSLEKLKNRIDTATRGRVASYRVLTPAQPANAGIEIRVGARIATYKSNADTRRRIAFLPLRAARATYECDGEKIPGAIASSQLLHALSQKITSSRKFMVLDREYTNEIVSEQRVIAESSASDDLSKLGAILGADYIVAGTIENFGVQTETVNAGSIAVERKVGNAALALRIIDAATGQIKFSETINIARLPIKRDVSSASMDLAEQVSAASAARILEAIYPLMPTAIENGELVLDQGGDMLKVGDKYELFSLGDTLKHPRTGETLGRKETKCGVIEIIRVKPKTSDAKIIETTRDDLVALIKTKSLLCRPLKPDAPQPPPSLKTQLQNEW